jgi:GNAT superfamily N-acetyltransferase
MPGTEFELVPFGRGHDRDGFVCGVESLDRYFRTQASQDVRRRANSVFVLARPARPAEVVGYFTLCAIGLPPSDVPDAVRKHLPRYPQVSATLLGRLAIAQGEQGRGIGSGLLSWALTKAWRNAAVVGSCMVVVDALDESAVKFYEAHRFERLPGSMRLILPMRTLDGLVADNEEKT